MAIKGPGEDRHAPLAAGASAESGDSRLFCFALQSRRRRKKVGRRRCGQAIEAKPALGQIRPFEVAWPRLNPILIGVMASNQTVRQEDNRTDGAKTCDGASTAAKTWAKKKRAALA
jgi:hypothetical protein